MDINPNKKFKVTTPMPPVPDIDSGDSKLSFYDKENPDINLFNLVDDEVIRISGSKLQYFKYERSESNFDDVYMEERNKPIASTPIIVHSFYNPKPMEEDLGQFGINVTNDQIFTFNKSYIEQKLGRLPISGDVVLPQFQNVKYLIYQVQEDSFSLYGVYHLNCYAKVYRDDENNSRIG